MALFELSVDRLVSALRSGEADAATVIENARSRIASFDPALNSFVELRDAAPDEAAHVDPSSGPLAGVPVAVKDVFAVDDRPPGMGSRVHAEWMRGTAAVVDRLRRAGAIVLGYTNLHEWAIGTTSTETATGPIRNPWNPDHVAGGSSGGSAAALAAGFAPAAIGSDMGGSIRIPAACCGVVGLKPTWGLVPTAGYVGDGVEIDHVGPMARTVEDVRTLLDVLAPADYSSPAIADLTIGVAEPYFFDDVEPATGDAIAAAVEVISSLVRRVVRVEVAGVAESRLAVSLIALPAVARVLGDTVRDRRDEFQPETAQVLALGAEMSEEDRAHGAALRDSVRAGWDDVFRDVDVVLTPTLPAPPALVSEKIVELPSGVASADLSYIALNGPMNLGGVPSLSLPCGSTNEGWSVGLSLTAARGRDATVLGIGAALEAALDGAFANRVAPIPAG